MTASRTAVLLHGVSSSRSTWWRVGHDLEDLGWRVLPLDLVAHGGRRWSAPRPPTITDLAEDVLQQVPGPVDLLVGHSLGAIVALAVLGLEPRHAAGLVLEDPPGPLGRAELAGVADEVEQSSRRASADRDAEVAAVLHENLPWSPLDAAFAVDGSRELDLAPVLQLLRAEPWDLQALVAACGAPVQLLAATHGSALLEPDRSVLLGLPGVRGAVVESGHCIHRDRPGLWLHEVVTFAETLG